MVLLDAPPCLRHTIPTTIVVLSSHIVRITQCHAFTPLFLARRLRRFQLQIRSRWVDHPLSRIRRTRTNPLKVGHDHHQQGFHPEVPLDRPPWKRGGRGGRLSNPTIPHRKVDLSGQLGLGRINLRLHPTRKQIHHRMRRPHIHDQDTRRNRARTRRSSSMAGESEPHPRHLKAVRLRRLPRRGGGSGPRRNGNQGRRRRRGRRCSKVGRKS